MAYAEAVSIREVPQRVMRQESTVDPTARQLAKKLSSTTRFFRAATQRHLAGILPPENKNSERRKKRALLQELMSLAPARHPTDILAKSVRRRRSERRARRGLATSRLQGAARRSLARNREAYAARPLRARVDRFYRRMRLRLAPATRVLGRACEVVKVVATTPLLRGLALVAVVLLGLIVLFPRTLLVALTAAAYWCYARLPTALGRLCSWAMRKKTEKTFDWTIERASVDLAWPFGPGAKPSRVTFRGWTWHNPRGFSDGHILEVDQLTVEFDLSTAIDAVRDRYENVVNVPEIHLRGVRFAAERNHEDALNLAVALDLPDDDENVIARRFAEQRRQQRREAPFTGITAPADVRQERRPWWDPLAVFWVAPNVEPATPNRSRGYQLRQVTKQPSVRKGCGSRCCASLKRCFGRGERYERTASGRQVMEGSSRPQLLMRQDTPVHDAKRRPRWGLRWKLDVAHVFATDVRLELTEKALYGQSLFGGAMMGNARSVSLPHVHVPRDAIVNQDKRREQGVYLGEVVFTLIFALLNKVAYLYPARVVSNGTLAAVLGLKNKAKGAGTRAAELFINNVGHVSPSGGGRKGRRRGRMWPQSIEQCLAACYLRPDPREGECVLSVELMQGRRMTLSNVNGVRRINAQVVFQLARQDLDEGAAFVDQGSSGVRIWTKAPVWNQTFELGPVRDLAAMTLRVICLDRGLAKIGKRGCGCACRRQQKPTSVPSRARAMSFSEEPSAQIEVKLANVFLLGNAAPNNARKGIVGWFPLVPKDVGGAKLTGELKLRFHLKRAHLLEGLDEACRQELIAHPAAYIRVLNRHTSYEPAAW